MGFETPESIPGKFSAEDQAAALANIRRNIENIQRGMEMNEGFKQESEGGEIDEESDHDLHELLKLEEKIQGGDPKAIAGWKENNI